ncbi:MAG: Lon protease family protein [Anaerolineae bacterium]
MSALHLELLPEQLRARTSPSAFPFSSTAELPPLDRILGQTRAVRAIDFGIDMPGQGYNIYVAGPAGSGRTTVARQFLDQRAAQLPVPPEWCYVYNFQDPRRPNALRLGSGGAVRLRDAMDELTRQLLLELPRAFEGEFFEQRRREVLLDLQQKQQELVRTLEQYLNERGFALIRSQMGMAIAPMVDGQALSGEDYEKLDPETRRKFESFRPSLQEQYDATMRQMRELDRSGRQAVSSISRELSGFVVDNLLADIREGFQDNADVLAYLDAVRSSIVENPGAFLGSPEEEKNPLTAMAAQATAEHTLDRFKVNVLAHSCGDGCAPVVIEDNPTYHNLIGRVEQRAQFGAMVTDFTQIRAGSLHRANGGYLIVEAKNLLATPLAWEGLKRALRNRQIKIEEMAQYYGMVATATLEPEPIPLETKVVIIGDEMLYHLLYQHDEDFRELFKVKAQFATSMPREEQACQGYAAFVGNYCRSKNLRHLGPDAVAELLDEASRLADDQGKVTTRMADICDVIREADLWAGRAGRELTTAEDVRQAVAERIYRLDYTAERIREMIQQGVVLVNTEGASIGQINGLSVMQSAGYEFGMPSRVSARTFMGKGGVVSIDREVKMSGPIHDKGQLILAAYLSSRFAQKRPLSVSATLTFEQNYGGIEGDSASSTELYALLSSLAGVPIKQTLAVTGSVSQSGQVQAIGGVNAKIEGYFQICRERGLNGEQGVLIPASNVRHLMLREDVVKAVSQGLFHIYAVSTVEEGIELLTGMPAGDADAEGSYPEGTVYARVQAKLESYAARLEEIAGNGDTAGLKADAAARVD